MNWTKSFEALGVKFDDKLEDMNVNITEAIVKIKATLKSWKNRFLTPYGKITVIKSLVLSKLTHLVLIIPTLAKHVLREIDVYIYDFLWNSKPNQIAKNFALLPEKKGGINMISIPEFWKSLKIAWLRRINTSKSFWLHILDYELGKINTCHQNILSSGNSSVSKYAAKIKNPFWSEVFLAGAELIEKSYFFQPHNFSLFPIVENSLFKIDNHNITPIFFRGIKSVQVADLLCEHNTTFIGRDQFNLRFELNINFLEFESLKRSILAGARKLNFNIHTSTIHPEPRQPLLISLLSVQKKGCRTFYDCLMSKQFLNTGTGSVENKWHTELGTLLSVHSWDHFYKMQSKIKFFNDIKWLQYRILHHSLKTNYVVSKFINDVNPDCTFCKANPETISHLFFFCPLVVNFWEVIKNTFSNFDVEINITASKIFFSDLKHSADSRNNMLILFAKMFIWKQKFEKKDLNIIAFKIYSMHTLTTLCCIYELMSKRLEFNLNQRWEIILLHLKDGGDEAAT